MEPESIGTSHRDAALIFLECFCAGNIDGLAPILAARLRVHGPLHQCASRDAYLATLRNDPPDPSPYKVLSVTESDDGVAVFYDYGSADGALTIAQLFRFKDNLIVEMRLVFDTDGLPEPPP